MPEILHIKHSYPYLYLALPISLRFGRSEVRNERKRKIGLMARIFVLPTCFRRPEKITQLAAPGFVFHKILSG
jgi:hypothetical protein